MKEVVFFTKGSIGTKANEIYISWLDFFPFFFSNTCWMKIQRRILTWRILDVAMSADYVHRNVNFKIGNLSSHNEFWSQI